MSLWLWSLVSKNTQFDDNFKNFQPVFHLIFHYFLDRPSPPQKAVISDIGSDDCMINWSPPIDDGGCPFRGYIIERKKASSSRWIRLNGALCTVSFKKRKNIS